MSRPNREDILHFIGCRNFEFFQYDGWYRVDTEAEEDQNTLKFMNRIEVIQEVWEWMNKNLVMQDYINYSSKCTAAKIAMYASNDLGTEISQGELMMATDWLDYIWNVRSGNVYFNITTECVDEIVKRQFGFEAKYLI